MLQNIMNQYLDYIYNNPEQQSELVDILNRNEPIYKLNLNKEEKRDKEEIQLTEEDKSFFNRYYDDKFYGKYENCLGVQKIKKKTKNIFEGIEDTSFIPKEVKEKANKYYNENMETGIKRQKQKDCKKFIALYNAYKKCEYVVTAYEVAKIFGLSKKMINKSGSQFSEFNTKFKGSNIYYNAYHYIPKCCDYIGISKETCDMFILPFAKKFIQKYKNFTQEQPEIVAAGLVKYYCFNNGLVSGNLSELNELFGCSYATIESMYKKIAKYDNL